MKIAIVGKGGSGKTTVSALLALHLDQQAKTVGLLDVDVNSHTAEVLGVKPEDVKELSSDKAIKDITHYLAGNSRHVKAIEFLSSTPPGTESGRWALDKDNYITSHYGNKFGERSSIFTLGSYGHDSIGADCHHTTQHIAENVLSHAKLSSNEVVIVDSVAGNDTFANSLYLQDILVFVVKPEREGLSVFERYYELAKKAGVQERVFVIGNQVSSDVQRKFLEKNIPQDRLMGILAPSDTITERRLEDLPLNSSCIPDEYKNVFDDVYEAGIKLQRTPREFYQEIVALHRRVSAQGWVAGAHRSGLVDQIDPAYVAS